MYLTGYKRPFVPSFGGIRLLYNVLAQGPDSFVWIEGPVSFVLGTFREGLWLEGGNFDVSPYMPYDC